jgi:hypothetical protein
MTPPASKVTHASLNRMPGSTPIPIPNSPRTDDSRVSSQNVASSNLNDAQAYGPNRRDDPERHQRIDVELGMASSSLMHADSRTSDPRQPLLNHLSSQPRTPPPDYATSPDSYSSGDMMGMFHPSPRRRCACCELDRERAWWDINIDEWNLCLGVCLMSALIVILMGLAVLWIWILLHQ